jgi:hypothetical protein
VVNKLKRLTFVPKQHGKVIDKKMCGSPDEAEYHTLSAKLGAS